MKTEITGRFTINDKQMCSLFKDWDGNTPRYCVVYLDATLDSCKEVTLYEEHKEKPAYSYSKETIRWNVDGDGTTLSPYR